MYNKPLAAVHLGALTARTLPHNITEHNTCLDHTVPLKKYLYHLIHVTRSCKLLFLQLMSQAINLLLHTTVLLLNSTHTQFCYLFSPSDFNRKPLHIVLIFCWQPGFIFSHLWLDFSYSDKFQEVQDKKKTPK